MNEFAEQLRKAVAAAPEEDRLVTIHLFGIGHAARLEGVNLMDLTEQAGIGVSLAAELRKGLRLSNFVQLNARGLTRI
jgi:hypothetical protein